ncbi:hypothetical protein [Longitalea arenae]|uniref:hypothetical protein n=1 Tax=Longitalea arenae TaxID=2812558 RepID=UPI00196771B6|nr:hypothetical protein [Longitalea arenae]
MKCIFSCMLGGMMLCLAYCKNPMPITANPDDHTNASGTAGSAKMTNQLPGKNNNVPLKLDTIKLPNDTLRGRQ